MYRSRRTFLENRLHRVCAVAALAMALAAITSLPIRAQEQYQYERDLTAKPRLYREVGAGFRQIRRGPNGNYYVLTAPAPAVIIYDPSGKRIGQVPNSTAVAAKGAALLYGESFDVDHDGRVVVCDRGANSVKIYSPGGALAVAIPLRAPVSVVFLPGDEFAVASPDAEHLVMAFDLAGKLVRDYGDREEIADRSDVNTQVNFGHLVADEAGKTYLPFDYCPEPRCANLTVSAILPWKFRSRPWNFSPPR